MNLETEKLLSLKKQIDEIEINEAINLMIENNIEGIKALEGSIKEISLAVEDIYKKLSKTKTGRLVYVGAGTSGRIGVQDGSELYPTFNWPLNRFDYMLAGGYEALTKSIERAEDDIIEAKKIFQLKKISSKDVVIGLSASSRTPFTIEIIKLSKKIGALTIGIGNNVDGKLQKISDIPITLNTGREVIAGSTRLKAGTSQKVCLNIISSLVMVKFNKVRKGLMIELVENNEKLKKRKKLINNLINT